MKKGAKIVLAFVLVAAGVLSLNGCSLDEGQTDAKPVIYLYPEEEIDVSISLHYNGTLTTTYPEYRDGWEVTARPDGSLTDHRDGKEYSYLFWEGEDRIDYDMSEGYVVRGEDTREFLQQVLPQMGLLPKEYNEMIVYWLPKMESNPYNLITFQSSRYTENARLEFTPKPDSILRVFMAYRPLSEPVTVKTPEIVPFERTGFTVVEWGGCQIQ